MGHLSRSRPAGVDTVDALERLRAACAAARALDQQLNEVLQRRDVAMADLHRGGFSYQAIATETGLTRGRIAQIVRAQTA
ncbi:MAG: hypothetical protein ABR549_00905 [Mycobacteriales bacterium]